jgi:flagellar hook protein FlgE
MVDDPNSRISYYTRAGQFEWDKDGNLVTPDGFIAQGYAIDPTTGAMGGIGDITSAQRHQCAQSHPKYYLRNEPEQ